MSEKNTFLLLVKVSPNLKAKIWCDYSVRHCFSSANGRHMEAECALKYYLLARGSVCALLK